MGCLQRIVLAGMLVLCVVARGGLGVVEAEEGGEEEKIAATEPLVVARVGETPIFRASLASALGRTGYDRLKGAEQKLRGEAGVLSQLVDELLLRQIIEREGAKATEPEIDAFVSQIQTQLAPSRIPFETFLTRSGRDEKTLRSHVAIEIGVNKLITPKLTPEALAAFYDEHRKELDGTLVRVSHIVLRPDAARGADTMDALTQRAEKVRSEILQGTLSFAEAAKRYSAGPSRRRGGDIGYVPRQSPLAEEFSSQVFSLRKGDVSKPFATPSGIHIATVTDIRMGSANVEKLRAQLEKMLAQKILRELLAAERASTKVYYAPGVAHFEADADRPGGPPKLVVEPQPVGE